jgi:UDP:flavonoid glycosyltransferase YjiC (YdhE family)
MKIVIPTIGSRGDVQPFIALAQGLARAGHVVTLASLPMMKVLVETHGVKFSPIGPDINLAEEVAAIRRQARNTAIGLMRAMQFGFDMLERSHEDLLALCRDAELVVVPTAVAVGKNEAELLHIPYLSVTLMPWAIPWDDPRRPFFKRMAYGAVDGLVALITTRPLNRIRKHQGLPPVGKEGFTSSRLNLVPVSPAVYPLNPLWESHHRMVGFFFSEPPVEWQPPAELLDFVNNGAPPLLISLGAMSLGDQDALENASLFVEATRQSGVRAIVVGWIEGMKQLILPPDIYSVVEVPFGWLMPRCAGVVHHGGYGTTAAGLRAGIPALVIPHIADQFYWGQIVQKLGVGLPAIPRSKLSCERLAVALKDLAYNESLHAVAAELGEKIRTENGVGSAVKIIQEEFA